MAFINGEIESNCLKKELKELENELNYITNKLNNLEDTKRNTEYKQDISTIFNIKETEVDSSLFDINKYAKDEVIQIIPRERKSKFDKNKFTILEIEV